MLADPNSAVSMLPFLYLNWDGVSILTGFYLCVLFIFFLSWKLLVGKMELQVECLQEKGIAFSFFLATTPDHEVVYT